MLTDMRKLAREFFGLFLLFFALLVLLSLLTHNAADPSINHVVSHSIDIQNNAGLLGAYISGFLNDVFGIAAFAWPLVFGAVGAACISSVYELLWWRWIGYFLLTLCFLCFGAAWNIELGHIAGGGMIGKALYENASVLLSPSGSALMWFFMFIFATQLSFGISWLNVIKKLVQLIKNRAHFSENINSTSIFAKIIALGQRLLPKNKQKSLPELYVDVDAYDTSKDQQEQEAQADIAISDEDAKSGMLNNIVIIDNEQPCTKQGKKPVKNTGDKSLLPPFDLLQTATPSPPTARENMEERGERLMACLTDFGIQGELVRITPGPVVTMYEVRPAAGVRVNRIANLNDDLALALKAHSVRIQAPIPGSDTVGIEIPNIKRAMVNFREILESPAFSQGATPLGMAVGKDIAGNPFVADLSKMPHLLVAGATGAGKSVGLNSILLSLLYTAYPEDMQLLLIDPKRIEMAVYADLPHLVHPVVTEMQHAKTALDWAVHEMDSRYAAMAKLGVRNISSYNQKIAAFGTNKPQDISELEHMPYLVIIIDELADLMLTAAREVETSIVRLAQLARAAGIHMVLATQRPSVDVVTGLIKANFPCRISFQVSSKHDSRTILDTVGAEHLLGRGDMLFKPSGGRIMRLHGPFVPDEEVQAVVEHWKKQRQPNYKVDFSDWGSNASNEANAKGFNDEQDALYNEVRSFVQEQGKASISLIQRRFKIGFNRAARLMEQLEYEGIIGPADGSKPRIVL